MTAGKGKGSFPVWKKLVFAGAVCALVLGGLNLGWNTNTFGPDEVCHGLLPAGEMERTLGRSGRLESDDYKNAPGKGDVEFRCSVRQTSKLLGHKDAEVRIGAYQERADFAFTSTAWRAPARMSYFSGPATGAVSDSTGWVMLPESCWGKSGDSPLSEKPPVYVIEASATGAGMKQRELARMLVKTAGAVSQRAGCASGNAAEDPEPLPAASVRPMDSAKACGIPGLALDVSGDTAKGRPVERARSLSAKTEPVWACDLLLGEKGAPYASFAVVRDTRMTSAISQSLAHHSPDAGVMASCGGEDTYFTMKTGARYAKASEASGSRLPDEKTLFKKFVDGAKEQMNCGTSAP
ncbi:hypothetical protein AB0I49_27000 [Streptomyces sp. NPDC050617]|uniref:hypothetical protein n=1 Tax=Streptomyces sp. NPDC050617 TaxID=3154628 RepID=UPI003448E5B5